MASAAPITLLVQAYANGDKRWIDCFPLVYAELRRIAQKHLCDELPGDTLQPTALVHEMYARLAGQAAPDVRDRIHFLSVAADVIRQILSAPEACMETPAIMICLNDALNQLARHDPNRANLELRFFGGMTAEESASLVNLSVNVVRRELRVAHAWLQRELNRNETVNGDVA